jgi:hypothetical protein
MRCVFALAPLAVVASACGSKADPYARSLARGSEHVELKGSALAAGVRVPFAASGDFTNSPDRGSMTLHFEHGATFREIVTSSRVYIQLERRWYSVSTTSAPVGTQTPAEILRAHAPGRIEGGVVRHVDIHTPRVTMSIDFSRYGEPVHVAVPRSAVFKPKGRL